jgi:hypothetical protein
LTVSLNRLPLIVLLGFNGFARKAGKNLLSSVLVLPIVRGKCTVFGARGQTVFACGKRIET